jgi:hypothetical protein
MRSERYWKRRPPKWVADLIREYNAVYCSLILDNPWKSGTPPPWATIQDGKWVIHEPKEKPTEGRMREEILAEAGRQLFLANMRRCNAALGRPVEEPVGADLEILHRGLDMDAMLNRYLPRIRFCERCLLAYWPSKTNAEGCDACETDRRQGAKENSPENKRKQAEKQLRNEVLGLARVLDLHPPDIAREFKPKDIKGQQQLLKRLQRQLQKRFESVQKEATRRDPRHGSR